MAQPAPKAPPRGPAAGRFALCSRRCDPRSGSRTPWCSRACSSPRSSRNSTRSWTRPSPSPPSAWSPRRDIWSTTLTTLPRTGSTRRSDFAPSRRASLASRRPSPSPWCSPSLRSRAGPARGARGRWPRPRLRSGDHALLRRLKHEVILDVMTIAGLFVLRVLAGAVAVGADASAFLLLCTGMVALFLGFTRRRRRRRPPSFTPGPRRGRCSSATRSPSSTRWSRWSRHRR